MKPPRLPKINGASKNGTNGHGRNGNGNGNGSGYAKPLDRSVPKL